MRDIKQQHLNSSSENWPVSWNKQTYQFRGTNNQLANTVLGNLVPAQHPKYSHLINQLARISIFKPNNQRCNKHIQHPYIEGGMWYARTHTNRDLVIY